MDDAKTSDQAIAAASGTGSYSQSPCRATREVSQSGDTSRDKRDGDVHTRATHYLGLRRVSEIEDFAEKVKRDSNRISNSEAQCLSIDR